MNEASIAKHTFERKTFVKKHNPRLKIDLYKKNAI